MVSGYWSVSVVRKRRQLDEDQVKLFRHSLAGGRNVRIAAKGP